jgi:hypothetical protein
MGVGTRTVLGSAFTKRLRRFAQPTPVVAPLIASEALKCSRRIGFRLLGVRPDIEWTREDRASFESGDWFDSICAEVIVQERDARIQLPFHWLPLLALKGKADGGYRTTMQRKVVVEVKSTNEKGWSRAVGLWEGIPAAPKAEWLVQGGLAACSPVIDAQLLHIVLCDSERVGEVAEWWVDVDEPLDLADWPADVDFETGEKVLPSVRSMVRAELWRQAEVLAKCEQGTLPARVVPAFGLVMVPPANDERGEPWQCRFCPFQPSCSRLSPNDVEDYGEMVA